MNDRIRKFNIAQRHPTTRLLINTSSDKCARNCSRCISGNDRILNKTQKFQQMQIGIGHSAIQNKPKIGKGVLKFGM